MTAFDNLRDKIGDKLEEWDDTPPIVKEKIENAKGDSVNIHLALDNSGSSSLNEGNILSYIQADEQPHYIFNNSQKGVKVNDRGNRESSEPSDNKKSYLVLTDQRILILIGNEHSDYESSIDYDSIIDFDISSGMVSNKIEIQTREKSYTFPFSRTFPDDIHDVQSFLEWKSGFDGQSVEYGEGPHHENRDTYSISEVKQSIKEMDEYDFESLVSDIWSELGWRTKVTTGSADRGIDVIAKKNEPVFQKQLIQAKRYSATNTVGSPDIQQYASLLRQEDDVDSVIVVTTSDFSHQAEEVADDLNVKLINGQKLVEIIDENGLYHVVQQYTTDEPNRESKSGSSSIQNTYTESESTSTSFDQQNGSEKNLKDGNFGCLNRQPTRAGEYTDSDKVAVGILAVLLGGLGAHKFYQGNVKLGVIYLCFFWTGIPAVLGLIEGILMLIASDREYEEKYADGSLLGR